MIEQLEAIQARFENVGVALTNPAIINNQKEFGRLSKEYRDLEKIMIPFEQYKKVIADYDFAKESLNGSDEEMRELGKMELPELEIKKDELEKFISSSKDFSIPKDFKCREKDLTS